MTLRGVRRELTGDYKCEVSADGPLFHTDIKVAHMIVAGKKIYSLSHDRHETVILFAKGKFNNMHYSQKLSPFPC